MTTDTVLVLTKDEYDLYILDELWRELEDAGTDSDVTLDFRNVRYMDGASLGMLVKYAKARKRKHGARVQIIRANPLIQRLLHLTSLDRIFNVGKAVA